MNGLAEAASRWAIEPDYVDVFGRCHRASAEALTRLIEAMRMAGIEPQPVGPPIGPLAAYQGDGRRYWALAVQLYAVHSRRNWGIGDFTDLACLVDLAATHGAAAVGLNPLHALFIDRPEHASPYAPNSRLFLNPIYIDVDAVPEFPGRSSRLNAEIAALRATRRIAYARVAEIKLDALRLAHRAFRDHAGSARRADFDAYRAEQGDRLLRFACFEVLRRRYAPAPWWDWPLRWRHPDRRDLEEFRHIEDEACEFHEFLQWIADRQMARCAEIARRRGMPIGLYTDLAIGIDPHGADAWSEQKSMLHAVTIGAPPDEFNPAGQNWGLLYFNPHALPKDDFAAIRRLMRTAMRHAGAVRLDHVLGLKRIYMIPAASSAHDGAYVRFPFAEQLRTIVEESRRARCIVIGEDLGTVPDDFRATVARWGLWSSRVMLFEREHDGRFRPPNAYPERAIASFATHDLPLYRSWITAHDLQLKQELGLDPGESSEARVRAQQFLREATTQYARRFHEDDVTAIAAFLAATPCRLVAISMEDVLGLSDPINIPGTTAQYPNWRHKLPVALEDLGDHDGLRRIAEVFAQAGRAIAE